MKLFTTIPKIQGRTFIIDEGQFRQLREDKSSYETLRQDQAYRYKVFGTLAEKGYLFHGSDKSFDSFDSGMIKGGTRGTYGWGAYFTNAAYKCSEYGNEFVIVDGNGMNFLDLEDDVDDNDNVFSYYSMWRHRIEDEIYEAEYELDNCSNTREYDMLQKHLSELENKLKTHYGNNGFNIIYDIASMYVGRGDRIKYRNLNNIIRNKNVDGKTLSDFYLSNGYDGFKCGTEYVIFNFEKLNRNIVKDKDSLINSVANIE